MRSKLTLTLDDARPMMEAGLSAAKYAGLDVSIAVVDEAGALVAFQRMAGARAHTIELAQQKARVSAVVGAPSAMIAAAGRTDITGGGAPLRIGGDCVGAVGVSGASVEDDMRIAEAALSAAASE